MKLLFCNLIIFHFLLIAAPIFGKNAQVDVQITMVNGEIKTGKLELPISNNQTRVVFRESEDAKKNAIRADDISNLYLMTKKDTFFIKRDSKYNQNGKLGKDKYWLLQKQYCSNFSTYVLVLGFEIDRDETFYETYLDGMGMFLIQGANEEHPTELGYIFIRKIITGGLFDKQRVKFLKAYYKNDTEAMQFIDSKKKISQDELLEYLYTKCEL